MNNFTRQVPFGETENSVTLIIYALLIVLGLITNAYIIYVFLMNKSRTKFCRFLLQLSLINIGQYIGVIPYLVIDLRITATYNKYYESFLCSVSDGHSCMLVFSMASCLLLTFMSILRCESMIKPFLKCINDQNLNKIFLFTWLFGCLSFIPYVLSYRLDHQAGVCLRKWIIADSFGVVYMTIMYACGMIIPLTAMITACVISYVKIYKRYSRENTLTNITSIVNIRHQAIFRLINLAVIFMATWFPYSIYWVLTYTTYGANDVNKQMTRLKILRYVLIPSLLGNIAGPLLNAYYWKPFQSSVKNWISCSRPNKSYIEEEESHGESLPSTILVEKKKNLLVKIPKL